MEMVWCWGSYNHHLNGFLKGRIPLYRTLLRTDHKSLRNDKIDCILIYSTILDSFKPIGGITLSGYALSDSVE